MATFLYEAMNAAGQAVRAEVEAATATEAVTKIRGTGCFPTKVTEARRAKKTKEAAAGGGRERGRQSLGLKRLGGMAIGRVSTRALAEFTDQLSTLQDAGLPIVRSLKVLGQQEKPGVLRNVVMAVAEGVEGGETMSEAMGRHPRAFDRLYVNMVRAGETGGVLDVILQRLAEFMEKSQRLRRRVIGAMIYPTVVILFSVLILTGIMTFVVPRFADIFKDFHADMPRMTVWLMGVSEFMAHQYGWAMVLGAPVVGWWVVKMVGRTELGRWGIDAGKLRLPVVGRIVGKVAVARWTRTLGTLLAAGVPILEAIGIARDTVGNVVFERALGRVQDAIREGESFTRPLRGTKVCDALVTNMIDVGEETGDLDKMLLKIADKYDEQVDVLVGSLVSLLEPVMVVMLGGMVGTIVVALFLPLIEILKKLGEG